MAPFGDVEISWNTFSNNENYSIDHFFLPLEVQPLKTILYIHIPYSNFKTSI